MNKYIQSSDCILKDFVAIIFVGMSFCMCSPKFNSQTRITETTDKISAVSVEHLNGVKKENQSTITDNTIQILTENGSTPRSGVDETYLFFKDNGKIIKRKVERYERISLSPSQNLIAVFKRMYGEATYELTLYNLNGDSILIKTDGILGRLVLADDGKYALIKNPHNDPDGKEWKVYFFDKNGKFKYEYEKPFYFSYEAAFSKSGTFAIMGYVSDKSYNVAEVKIFDSDLTLTGTYSMDNFGNKSLSYIRFDASNNIIISTYNIREGFPNPYNFRLLISNKGELINKLEGWENE